MIGRDAGESVKFVTRLRRRPRRSFRLAPNRTSVNHGRKETGVADIEPRHSRTGRNIEADEGQRARMDFSSGHSPNPRPVAPAIVSFDRHELREIMNVYGRKVAEGEWKDYAIDFGPSRAVFSIFRRASEMPLFRIEKDPKLARKQGAYSVIAATGLILKRGPELARVIAVLDKKIIKLVVG
jgi:hypothetical protein